VFIFSDMLAILFLVGFLQRELLPVSAESEPGSELDPVHAAA
jgi:hypothetical protein